MRRVSEWGIFVWGMLLGRVCGVEAGAEGLGKVLQGRGCAPPAAGHTLYVLFLGRGVRGGIVGTYGDKKNGGTRCAYHRHYVL